MAATLVGPIFSPHIQPGGRQLTACVMSRSSLPAVTAVKDSLMSRFRLASMLPSEECWRQSRLHHSWRMERMVLKRRNVMRKWLLSVLDSDILVSLSRFVLICHLVRVQSE